MESQPKEMRERGHHTHVHNNRGWVGLLTSLFFCLSFFSPSALLKAAYTTAAAIIEDNDVIIHRNDGGGGFSVVVTSDTPAQKLARLSFSASIPANLLFLDCRSTGIKSG
jgi:hypothetical protein